jgi:hypothetical protein
VLALGGVLAIGCAADAARRGMWRAAPWLLAGCVVLAALAAAYSRGAVMMAFLALAMWNASVAWSRRSWKHFLLGTSALVVAASSMLVFGGPIADRFAKIAEAGADFRFRIWQDTIALSASSPWFGTGLGNFAALFPFFRKESITPAAVIHPESDWLWLATEIGWVGVACFWPSAARRGACRGSGRVPARARGCVRAPPRLRARGNVRAGALAATGRAGRAVDHRDINVARDRAGAGGSRGLVDQRAG